jgi:hypothetical protein
MRYFIRFTDTIEQDIERGTSIITCDRNGIDIDPMIVSGLCAFGYYDSIEQCLEEAPKKAKWFDFGTKTFAILLGYRSDVEGSIGCVVEEPRLVSIHNL